MPRVTRRQASAANSADPSTTSSASSAMPQAATATTAPTLPLDGCIIALSGTFPSLSHTALQKDLTSLGAKFARSVTTSTTHLVSTKEDYAKDSPKVVAAKANNIAILDIEWAMNAIENKARPSETSYSLQVVKKRPIAVAKSDTKAIGDTGDEDGASQTKKRKTAKGGKAAKATATKVKAETPEPDEEPAPTEKSKNKSVAEAQVTKCADLVVPVDEFFHLSGKQGFVVYIDDDGVIYDASLNQTNASNNNNKFYKVQVVMDSAKKDYFAWTRWGRVGETGQKALLGNGTLDDALKHFDKKFKDKSGIRWVDRSDPPKPGKYAYIERSYDPDSDDEGGDDGKTEKKTKANTDENEEPAKVPECTLEKPIRELVELIFNAKLFNNVMESLNYDANKLPLGKLGKGTITKGFQALKDLSVVLADPNAAMASYNMATGTAIEHFSNLYYSLIPHAFGRNRPPIIGSPTLLKKEVDLLESLSDMKAASDIMKLQAQSDAMHPLDRQFQGLGLQEMSVLDKGSTEYKLLADYLHGSRGSTHHYSYEIAEIFRIERVGEKSRFEKSRFSSIKSDKRLLWHGSRCTNFGGILSQGLRIAPPEAPVSGYMFGKGIYLADMSSKSAGYCASGASQGHALLLLCEAELGNPMQKLVNASYGAGTTAAQNGMASTWGQGRTGPQKWRDAGVIHPSLKGVQMPDVSVGSGDTEVPGASLYYNEYICYDVAQVQLRYLFRVKM
ncbi:hypothetical protein jhhlp_003034 [Lomentospora prolificans]|uniref:Poly [ADP-ribose] polymerase n=1 Tax=Lomentospora prolificans TaxID=41688 RepID=A0A2N3NFX7_9PEZI|nr:hypothetical protein jhhlp_003034 [Lomentospora prolificans]